jgi:hypothetical protein
MTVGGCIFEVWVVRGCDMCVPVPAASFVVTVAGTIKNPLNRAHGGSNNNNNGPFLSVFN